MRGAPVDQGQADIDGIAGTSFGKPGGDAGTAQAVDLREKRFERPISIQRRHGVAGLRTDGQRAFARGPCPQRSTRGRDGGFS